MKNIYKMYLEAVENAEEQNHDQPEISETEEIFEDGPAPEEVKDSLFDTPKKVEKDPETGLTKVTVA